MIQPLEPLPPLPPEVVEQIRQVRYDFLVRTMGEEMARVSFLPLEERKRYLHDMIDHARSKGVKFDKPARGVTP